MNPVEISLFRYKVPLTEPLKLAGGTLDSREGVLIQAQDTGFEGWGEASPLPGFSPETFQETLDELKRFRQTPDDASDFAGAFESEPDMVASARFGFETALLNLRAARISRTLPQMLADTPRSTVALTALLSGRPEDVLRGATEARDAGYRTVKLKVGVQEVEADANLVGEVSATLGGRVALRLDANRAWSLPEALEFDRLTRGLESPVEYLEEPLVDPTFWARFVDKTGTPVALDETLVELPVERLKDHRYARAVVLKPTLLGLSRALRLAVEATRLGLTPVVSSAYETGVGTAALVALAAATGDAPAGLDTYRRLGADVVSPRLVLGEPELDVGKFFAVRRVLEKTELERVSL